MQIEGLIPFKSSIDQAIASLYFLKIPSSFYSFSFVKSIVIIIGFYFSAPKKARHNSSVWVILSKLTP